MNVTNLFNNVSLFLLTGRPPDVGETMPVSDMNNALQNMTDAMMRLMLPLFGLVFMCIFVKFILHFFGSRDYQSSSTIDSDIKKEEFEEKRNNKKTADEIKENIIKDIKEPELSEIEKFKLLISDCIAKISQLDITNEIKDNLNEALNKSINKMIEKNDEINIEKLKTFYIPELLKLIDKYEKLSLHKLSTNTIKTAKNQIIDTFVKFTDALNILQENHINKEATQASVAAQVLNDKLNLDGLVRSKFEDIKNEID